MNVTQQNPLFSLPFIIGDIFVLLKRPFFRADAVMIRDRVAKFLRVVPAPKMVEIECVCIWNIERDCHYIWSREAVSRRRLDI